MLLVQSLLIVVILAIAYKKEIISLYNKMKEKREDKGLFTGRTKKFIERFCALALCTGLMLAVFLICICVIPGEAGYFVGGILDVFVVCAIMVLAT